MKTLRYSIAVLFLSVITSLFTIPVMQAYASPSMPMAGVDYEVLDTSVLTSDIPANKVEVLNFFSYGSPNDYSFEPKLANWAKRQGPDVIFNRVPVASNPNLVPQQRLYHALHALGEVDQMTFKIFEAIQTKQNALRTPQAQANFVAQEGVDRQRFLSAYHSSKTTQQLEIDNRLIQQYAIRSVPTLVVQGKYKISPVMSQSFDATLQVLDFLVSKARSERVQAQ